ncbi:hypothetical protein ABZW44_22570 [Streptomyces mirabilis]|uniref:hypothetical protein n=1 Tax=Streptomyces mirabilis TaxID=68239 RepID=UPI0033B9DA49
MTNIVIDLTGGASKQSVIRDDFVLYRDPIKWLNGVDGHTRVYRVETAAHSRLVLIDIASGARVIDVDREYVRPIPVTYIMRDVDESPLASDYPDLTPAAVAWLQQNTAPQARPAELEQGGA